MGMHESSFLFALAAHVVTDIGKAGVLSELLHAKEVSLMSETIERIGNELKKQNQALRPSVSKFDLEKPKSVETL